MTRAVCARHNSVQEATAWRLASGASVAFGERLAGPQRPNRYAARSTTDTLRNVAVT
jgi:hypothetical protein